MEQLGFEGMPRRLYTCTPTRLTSWLDCPRRYRMSYLDRPSPPKGPPWAHNSLGASVHNALAGWWRLPLAQRTVDGRRDLLGPRLDQRRLRRRARSRRAIARAPSPWWRLRGRAGPGRRAARRGADGRDPHRPHRGDRPSPAGSTALDARGPSWSSSTTRPDGTCSPRTTRAARWRWPCTRCRGGAGAAAGLPPGGTAPPAHRGPCSAWEHTRRNRWRGTCGRAEDIAAECAAADERMRGGLPRRRGTTRCSRRGPARPAAGATTGGIAPRAPRPPRAPSLGRPRGRVTPQPVPLTAAAYERVASAACQNAVSALAVVAGASTAGEWAAAGMHSLAGAEPAGHVLLRHRLPLVVVLAVQDEHGHRPASQLRRPVRRGEQVRRHQAQPVRVVAQHPAARNATMSPGTPAAVAVGSRCARQSSAIPARSASLSGRSPPPPRCRRGDAEGSEHRAQIPRPGAGQRTRAGAHQRDEENSAPGRGQHGLADDQPAEGVPDQVSRAGRGHDREDVRARRRSPIVVRIAGSGRLVLPAHVERDHVPAAAASWCRMARKSSLLPV